MPDGMVILLQGKASSRGVSVRSEHRHIAAVEPLVDGTERDHGVTDGRFVVEGLQHPSIPKPGDKKPREADHGPTAEKMEAPTLLLAAQVMERGGDGERGDDCVGGGAGQGHVRCTLVSSQIAVTFASSAGAFDTFGLPFITLDATHWLCVSGHIFEALVTVGFLLLRG